MKNEQLIEQVVREVLKSMKDGTVNTTPINSGDKVTKANYPLGEKMPDKIKTPTGTNFTDITLDKLISGDLKADDIRIAPETLEMQAQVAESVGRDAFSRNMRRAAELIAVPDDRILEIYDALRPYRSTKAEMYAIADELKTKYGCEINSQLVREAADIYEARGKLKG